MNNLTTRRVVSTVTATAFGLIGAITLATPSATAAGADRDHDGMPTRWELAHRLNPNVANGGGDADHDRLSNLAEYRHHTDPRDEDTDNDGMDDGDEVRDGRASTRVRDADTDDDGVRDGDEDADHDGIDNEDEDDAAESCLFDDDDSDHDNVADEDENELRTRVHDADTDDDGVRDGGEDFDHDGVTNEDDDDHGRDHCEDESEDDDDFLGTVVSFDEMSGALVIDVRSDDADLVKTVTGTTEVELGHGTDGDTSMLTPGTMVDHVTLAADGSLLEIEITPVA